MPLTDDVKTAVRSLFRSKATTAIAIVVLGLAIGANSSMFSLVNTLVLRPLAVPEPDRLTLVLRNDQENHDYRLISYPDYVDLRAGLQTFENLTAHNISMVGIGEGADVRRGFVDIVSSNYFDTFAAPLAYGRSFSIEEELPGAEIPVAIVSYRGWQRLGGTEDVLDSTLVVNGVATTIIGVARKGFSGTSALLAPELYVPLGMQARLSDSLSGGNRRSMSLRDNLQLMLIGRLRDGVSRAAANSDLARVSAGLSEEYPASNEHIVYEAHPPSRISVSTSPQEDDELAVVGIILMAMSLIVLLIAGFNLAALQDARNLSRRRELGVRLALGSGRIQLVRRLVVEALLLSLGGAILGLGISMVAPRLLAASLAHIAPFDIFLDGSLDWRILVATLSFSVLASLFVGLLPAIRASRADLVSDLKAGNEKSGKGRSKFGFSRGDLPVLFQLALSMVLLVSAGLFLKSAIQGLNIDPGFEVNRQVIMEVDPALAGYDEVQTRSVQRRMRERLRSVPGVREVALAGTTPFGISSRGGRAIDADLPLLETDAQGDRPGRGVALYTVSDGYFDVLEIPLLAGREFRDNETQQVGIIDELLAEQLFGEDNPIGRRVALVNSSFLDEAVEVVGVVATIRDSIFEQERNAHLYLPSSRFIVYNTQLHIATTAVPTSDLVGSLRGAAREVDEALPILDLRVPRQLLCPVWRQLLWPVSAAG